MTGIVSEMPLLQSRASTWPINPGRSNPDDDRLLWVPIRRSSIALSSIDKLLLFDTNARSKVEDWMGTGHSHAHCPHLDLHFISDILARMARSKSLSVGQSSRDAGSDQSRFNRLRSDSPEKTSSEELPSSQIGSLKSVLLGVHPSAPHTSHSATNGTSTPNSVFSFPTSSSRSHSGAATPVAFIAPWCPLLESSGRSVHAARKKTKVGHLRSQAAFAAVRTAFSSTEPGKPASTHKRPHSPGVDDHEEEEEEEEGEPSQETAVDTDRPAPKRRRGEDDDEDEERSHRVSLTGDQQ